MVVVRSTQIREPDRGNREGEIDNGEAASQDTTRTTFNFKKRPVSIKYHSQQYHWFVVKLISLLYHLDCLQQQSRKKNNSSITPTQIVQTFRPTALKLFLYGRACGNIRDREAGAQLNTFLSMFGPNSHIQAPSNQTCSFFVSLEMEWKIESYPSQIANIELDSLRVGLLMRLLCWWGWRSN